LGGVLFFCGRGRGYLGFEEEGFAVFDICESFFCQVAEVVVDKEVSVISLDMRDIKLQF